MLLSIAVDGPAGSGKSSVAKAVAEKLGITYLDTGAMYRMVTLALLKSKIDLDDMVAVERVLKNTVIEFKNDSLFLNNEDVALEIRDNIVAKSVSKVAAMGSVRTEMVAMQQEIAKGQSIIMDGRDIGTHVLTDASYKFFLVASVEERARRRLLDFKEQNIIMTLEESMADIESRDYQDSNREISPLRQADDAILIDTTQLNMQEVISYIIKETQQ